MKQFVWLVFAFLYLSLETNFGQISSQKINTSAFPNVEVTFCSLKNLNASNIKILENNIEIKHNLKNTDLSDSAKQGTCFLIESSFITHSACTNNSIMYIVSGITKYLKNNGKNSVFAFCSYSRTNKNNITIRKLTNGFICNTKTTSDILQSLINDREPEGVWTDMYKAIYESLFWMKEIGGKYQKFQLIVIGTGKALSESPIKEVECIERANEYKIPIYTLGVKSCDRYAYDNMKMLSEKTNAIFTSLDSGDSIIKALNGYISPIHSYSIQFNSSFSADGKKHTFQIQINGISQNVEFIAPIKGVHSASWIYIVVIGILTITLILFFWIRKQKSRKAERYLSPNDTDINLSNTEKSIHTNISSNKNPDLQENISTENSDFLEKRKHTHISTPPTGIIIINGNKKDTIMLAKGKMTFGRDSTNNIVVSNDTVSGKHFFLEYDGFSCWLTNLSQTNGTLINGAKIPKTIIYAGDTVKIGLVEIIFK
jgi:hypothetical protein